MALYDRFQRLEDIGDLPRDLLACSRVPPFDRCAVIARNRAATWSAMLAMMGLLPGCAAAIAPRTVLVTTPNADNQRGGCVHQSDVV